MRGGNGVGAAAASRFCGDVFACFDRLPAPVRRALHEGMVKWDPRVERWEINKAVKGGMTIDAAVARQVQAIVEADEREVRAFAHHWPSRFGRYPHLAADATILRYDEAARVRRGRGA